MNNQPNFAYFRFRRIAPLRYRGVLIPGYEILGERLYNAELCRFEQLKLRRDGYKEWRVKIPGKGWRGI